MFFGLILIEPIKFHANAYINVYGEILINFLYQINITLNNIWIIVKV